MSDKKKPEEEAFFNPFQSLQDELGKKTPPPAARPPAAAPEPKKQPSPPARSSRPEDEAALFLRAVSSPGFKPIKKDLVPPDRPARPEDAARPAKAGPTRPGEPPLPPAAPQQARPEKKRTGPANPEEEPTPLPLSEGEQDLFASAMAGVKPVDGKGRDLVPPRPEPKINLLEDPDYLQDFLQGKVEFALEYTDEFFEGHVMGLDPLVLAKLRSGQYSPESHIDLHGQNAEQAQESLTTFIRHAYNKGQRSLVVVTGRGKNSPGGLGVLRRNMQDWLTREPLKRVVLAFCTAQPKDGGAGALYVLLRKYKKSGKIRWDRRNWPQADL